MLLDHGSLEVAGYRLEVGDLACQAAGRPELTMRNVGDDVARALLLGGTPFGEGLVMWWKLVGRSHDDIVEYRRLWEIP